MVRLFRDAPHALSGAYAVNAIDDAVERERFERHLHRCQKCTSEVRGLTETAGKLALAAARPPPEQMRDDVLLAVSRTRQLPPVVERDRSSRARNWWTIRAPMLSFTVAAVSLAVTIALVIGLVAISRQLDAAKSRSEALSSVLGASDARAATHRTTDGGRATVVYSLRDHSMIFTSQGLPPPPPGKVYEMWLIGPPTVRPAGLLPSGQACRSGPFLAHGVATGDDFGLTVEPAGGTSKPTTTPIVIIPLRR